MALGLRACSACSGAFVREFPDGGWGCRVFRAFWGFGLSEFSVLGYSFGRVAVVVSAEGASLLLAIWASSGVLAP